MSESKFSDLESSISIIITLDALITKYLKILHNEKDNKESIIFAAVSSQILIIACSFLDEWNLIGKLSETDEKLLKARKIVKPAIDRINKWKDLRKIRNTILAHNLRIKQDNNKNVLFLGSIKYSIPNEYYDFALLAGCISLITFVLKKRCVKEYNSTVHKLKNLKQPTYSPAILDENEFMNEFKIILKSIQRLEDNIQ